MNQSLKTVTAGGAPRRIQSLDRGLVLLEHIVGASRPVPLKELAALLDVEKSSAHRLLATLAARDYVVRDAHRHYLSGPAVPELAARITGQVEIHAVVHPFLRQLAAESGETAHLAILRRDCATLVDCVPSGHALAVTSRIGQNEPVHCTALGKALLCDATEEELRRLLGRRLRRYTLSTGTSVLQFARQCKLVRAEALAEDDQEYRDGVRCLAAPLRNGSGRVAAAIGVSGPVSRLTAARLQALRPLVRKTGMTISQQLGFTFGKDSP